MDSENPIKEYTGVWIPAEVMESAKLTALDKLVYAEMAGFKECFASNAWFAEKIGKSERSIQRSISNLIKLGFVKNIGFNGRSRVLRVDIFGRADTTKMSWQTRQKCPHNNKEEYKRINNSETAENGVVEKAEYGNHEVNALLELWEHETGITANVAKANRLACYNLIRKRGFDGAKAVVELCGKALRSEDKYAPRISSFRDLQGQYEKLSKLEAWNARQNPEQKGISMSFYTRNEVEFEEISDEEREKVREAIKKAKQEWGKK